MSTLTAACLWLQIVLDERSVTGHHEQRVDRFALLQPARRQLPTGARRLQQPGACFGKCGANAQRLHLLGQRSESLPGRLIVGRSRARVERRIKLAGLSQLSQRLDDRRMRERWNARIVEGVCRLIERGHAGRVARTGTATTVRQVNGTSRSDTVHGQAGRAMES